MTHMPDPRDRGASAPEYALLVAAVAAVVVAVVFGLGLVVGDQFSDASTCIASGAAATC